MSATIAIPSSSSQGSGANSTEVPGQALNIQILAQHILRSTTCYDLMQASSKGTVFETTIPFQLAFFALIEHDTDCAVLWDPDLRQFIGVVTLADYLHALKLCQAHNLSANELMSQPISEILLSVPQIFRHYSVSSGGFVAIDAEDSVQQLVALQQKMGFDYIPVLDPENGNLISILGPLDVLYLLSFIAKSHEGFFGMSLATANSKSSNDSNKPSLGTYNDVFCAPKKALILDVLEGLDQRGLSACPVIDENHRLVGVYHKSDVSFAMRAADPDTALNNLRLFKVEECVALREQLLSAGDLITPFQPLVTCKITDSLSSILQAMVAGRSQRCVVVDETTQTVKGVVTLRDFLRFLVFHDSHCSL